MSGRYDSSIGNPAPEYMDGTILIMRNDTGISHRIQNALYRKSFIPVAARSAQQRHTPSFFCQHGYLYHVCQQSPQLQN